MIIGLVGIPLLGAAVALILRRAALVRVLLPVTAVLHAALTAATFLRPVEPLLGGWLALDALGRLFLAVTSALFLLVSFYTVGYLATETAEDHPGTRGGGFFPNAPQAVFVACLLAFLSMMTLVTVSQHFGILWVAVEGTTLASAPLIYFHRHARSLEATWKYLLICSVGIAMALLGSFFLAIAGEVVGGGATPMDVPSLLVHASGMHPRWLKASFVLLLVGYGTKMGLAPLHSWLPDAHSESPSAVSALLSGALLNTAFLGILRAHQVLLAAGQGAFSSRLLLIFGLLSMGFGAIFILAQTDYKRLLAYSSVEHMGILALGVGVGGAATAGAMLHLINHSIAKGLLFLVAGNILAAYKTRSIFAVRGLLISRPVSGILWMMGLFAIVGSPPFGTFPSEFVVLRGTLQAGGWLVPTLYLGALALAFIGLTRTFLGMAQGLPTTLPAAAIPGTQSGTVSAETGNKREPLLLIVPPAILAVLSLAFGLYLPEPLREVLTHAAQALGGGGF